MKLEDAFRILRAAWFYRNIAQGPQDRQWESEDQERLRKESNDSDRAAFDSDTEAIIRGEDLIIDPRCSNHIGKKSTDERVSI